MHNRPQKFFSFCYAGTLTVREESVVIVHYAFQKFFFYLCKGHYNNNYNERISRALFHVKQAQLR